MNDTKDNNNQNNNQNNSLYDNLNIYEEQQNISIEFIYDISYLSYKKKIFSLNINYAFKLIISLFDENICDILMNIYILKKKNKITEKQFILFKFIFDFIEKINKIDFIDQENFFLLITDFYKLNNLCIHIEIFFENYIFKELIDYKKLIDKFYSIFNKLNSYISLFKIFNELENLSQIEQFDLIKEKIIYLANKMSFDLFMFYNAGNIYDILLDCFTNFNDLTQSEEQNKNQINKNDKLYNIFESNKNIFINEYNKNKKKCIDIYSNDIELYIKFKIDKSDLIDKFIKNIAYIDELE